MPDSKQLLFKVVDPNGHEYLIYANGAIEGFGEGCWIINYHPQIVRSACIEYSEATNA